MNSILQADKECFVTSSPCNLHKHHIYGGTRRMLSEKYGCWVWLRADWHNLSDYGVHSDRSFDLRLKAECQERFEESHSREEFMKIFGRNYL